MKKSNKVIVLISCASRKSKTEAKAVDLYKGTLFEYSLKYARSIKPDKIFILSAKHHLLELNKKIAPYDVTLTYISPSKRPEGLKILDKKETIRWGGKVIDQLKEKNYNLDKDEFIILAGQSYIKPIKNSIKNLKQPLDKMRLGERIKFLSSETK